MTDKNPASNAGPGATGKPAAGQSAADQSDFGISGTGSSDTGSSDAGTSERSNAGESQVAASEDPAIKQVCEELLAKTASLQLATLGEPGENNYPHCGYTPYLMRQEGGSGSRQFYIFISELALHTRDLMRVPRASILLIEDEADAKQIFARTRLYYECDVRELSREHESYTSILDAYEARHGKMVNLLRQLPDFRLMHLSPVSGQFVMGFGRAYRLTGPGLNEFEHSRRA